MNKILVTACLILPLMSSCSYEKEIKSLEKKAALINRYENVALKLAKENRELHAIIKRQEFEIQKLTQDSTFRKVSSKEGSKGTSKEVGHGEVGHSAGRGIASVAPANFAVKTDLVEYKTYKWSADDMLKIADKEFKAKNFEKAAQFYTSILNYYPESHDINAEFYFKAGISAYESGEHHDWTLKHFETLMAKYPTSQYYRSAKLWVALTNLKLGNKDKFFATVEEFRRKYRNTNEWKILSSHYEKIEEKTHE